MEWTICRFRESHKRTARASACIGQDQRGNLARFRAASTLVWERLQKVTKATSAVTFGNLSKKQAHKRKYINHIHTFWSTHR